MPSEDEVRNRAAQAIAVMNDIGAAVTAAAADPNDAPPPTLYHFTDADGLCGIVSSGSFWLTMAAALNDRSEVDHGLEMARELLKADATNLAGRIAECLDPRFPIGANIVLQPFVASFCSISETSALWLHYGRSGTGFAIGVESSRLQFGARELRRVEYREDEQRAMLKQIVDVVKWKYSEANELQDANVFEAAARAAAWAIKGRCARIKSPAFAAEEEWRVLTYGSNVEIDSAPLGGENLSMLYRRSGSRVVPYVVATYAPLPVKELILGAAVHDGA